MSDKTNIVSEQPQQVQHVVGGVQWMPSPHVQIPLGCPPGLEYLVQVDQLVIKQILEMLEIFTGWETNNKYRITNTLGQAVYFAMEDTDCCTRYCCGPGRPFEMKILDNFQREVIHLSRPLKCQGCCCYCCLQEIEIQAPPGEVVGYCIQKWSLWEQKLEICDANRTPQLLIRGPCCPISCGSDVQFEVLSMDGGTVVGAITKQWVGCGTECFTDADTFSVTFPMDLDVKMKAVMLGTCFLVDFMFFEKKNN